MRARRPPRAATTLLVVALAALAMVACGIGITGVAPLSEGLESSVANDAATEDEEAAAPPSIECSTVSDCPPAANDCVVVSCESSLCVTKNVASGTVCATAGGVVCDGNGKCSACVVAGDCAPALSVCATNTCSSNACGTASAAAGLACNDNGGRTCDGKGTCVACVTVSDCPAQTTMCKTGTCEANACSFTIAAKDTPCNDSGGSVCDESGKCVVPHCTNGTKDQDETDVDCGGSCGATCKDTGPQQVCAVKGDCISGVCTGGKCQPPSCSDGVMNGNETDVDCGGAGFNGKPACAKCADTKHCAKNSDCAKNSCFGSNPGTCVSCMDSVRDGTETGVDCGGALCDGQGKTCPTGSDCVTGADCMTTSCVAAKCEPLADGKPCVSSAQCLHAACVGLAGGGKVCCNTGCTDNGPSSCGTNGKCLADGTACALYASGTQCGTTCSGSSLTTKTCNGTGTCASGAPASCPSHFACSNSTSCARGCGNNDSNGDARCASGYWCDGRGGGACQAALPKNSGCNRDSQCSSSNCSGNKCK